MAPAAVILFAISCAATDASLQSDGEALFKKCEFKAAAHVSERLGTDTEDRETLNLMVSQARTEYRDPEWALGKGILRISSAAEYLVPSDDGRQCC
jgi:hypothetical protein